MKILSTFTVAALALSCLSALAQSQAPGLWEHRVQFKTQSGQMEAAMAQMQQQLAALPPEQRKAMEQMMVGRGMSFGPKDTSFKVCVTPEEAKAGPRMSDEPGCKQQVVQRSASTLKMKWQCSGEPPSSGEGEVHFSGDKAFTGKATMTTRMDGKAETMQIEQSGRWLSADCGAVKPMR